METTSHPLCQDKVHRCGHGAGAKRLAMICLSALAMCCVLAVAEGQGRGGGRRRGWHTPVGEPPAEPTVHPGLKEGIRLHKQYMHVKARQEVLRAAHEGTEEQQRDIVIALVNEATQIPAVSRLAYTSDDERGV